MPAKPDSELRRVKISTHWSPDEARRLNVMADDVHMTRSALIRSLVLAVLDDDANAHEVRQ